MTALAAYWAQSSASLSPRAAAERMLRGQQIYAADPSIIVQAGDVALGRRLYVTLPEDIFDRGPITGGGGRWTLVSDVRLDARDELCAQLAIATDEAASLSDSALIMRAFERWQEDAIAALIGDFALILWDAKEARLTLARDFLGNRPLHYHQGKGFVAVASMSKGLHALPEIPREPNERTVAEFLGMLPQRGSESFFRDVDRVEPGEIVTISAGRTRKRKYWDFESKPLKLRDEEYVEATREAFDRAVAARLRGAGSEVGSHLSAGLDSSAVAATAARIAAPAGKVIAFTSAPLEGFDRPAFPNRFNDESALAAEVAAIYPNMEHVIVRGAAQSPLAALDRNYFLYDRPMLNLCNGVWVDEILDLGKARGLKVLLIGDMGNMTTSYDGFENLSRMLSRGRLWPAFREAALLRRNGMRLKTTIARMLGPFLPRPLWEAIYRQRGRNFDITNWTALNRDCADSLARAAKSGGETNSAQPWGDSFAVRKSYLRRIDLGNFFKGYLGGWGIDVRDPTGDRRLVELCFSIPPQQFLKDGQLRSLARRAFADRLPQSIIQESRSGYQGADWYLGLRANWDTLRGETERISRLPAAAAMMDTDRLRALLDVGDDIDWNSRQTESAYRLALLRGISSGHFLRRASGAN
jgi:asparagine synthase (glutamine-hydrolysing)